MYCYNIPNGSQFDYVIVGGGSAGCVLANRLSGRKEDQVLLIEAGDRDDRLDKTGLSVRIPLFVANLVTDRRATWSFESVPQTHQNGRKHHWTFGKILGGSGSLNGNLYVRGNPIEYDNWRRNGCVGWGYEDLLPFFAKIEDRSTFNAFVRRKGRGIRVTRLSKFDPLSEAFLAATRYCGYRSVSDYNDGVNYEGASYLQLSTRNGLRFNSSREFVHPIVRRPNLCVLLGATASKIVIQSKAATAVEFDCGNQRRSVYARREVIVAAGPIHSPKLLEQSGVGDASKIRQFVNVIHHLPGVGENLRDHCTVRVTWDAAQTITINDVQRSAPKMLIEALRFACFRKGLLSISSSTVRAVIRSDPAIPQPDLNLRLQLRSGNQLYGKSRNYGSDKQSGFSIGVTVLQPSSVGRVHIQSAHHSSSPQIDPNYLSDEQDGQLLVKGVHAARRLAAAPSFRPFIRNETRPGTAVQTDEEVMQFVRDTCATSWHMVGTCKMGVDSMAVVDPELRVRGLHKLRVVDSSIFPTIPSSNPNAPTLATAEKGAAMILRAAKC